MWEMSRSDQVRPRVSGSDVRVGRALAVGLSALLVVFTIVIGVVLGLSVVAVVISVIGIGVASRIGIWFGDCYWKTRL